MKSINLNIAVLQQAYIAGELTPEQLIGQLLPKAKALSAVWIHVLSESEIAPYLTNLVGKSPSTHPLYGVPFAIKDNIDLAGIPTTAGCEAFSYLPEKSAHVVQMLIDAGAIPLGKTNLDQFATGLVGTRSPYGQTPNSFDANYISGGSSSGSAVATASGVVSFSLGSDTAGSGRIPACFNNLVGLKPSIGLLSASGLVPACRSLDCVSIFALTANDARKVFNVAARYDEEDCFARPNPLGNQFPFKTQQAFSFAVPKHEQLSFFGSEEYEKAFYKSVSDLEAIGGERLELDFSPMLAAAKLLYEGPWVAERYLATKDIIENAPEAMMDVTRTIIGQGKRATAPDTFVALYQLKALKMQADKLLRQVDIVVTPTAGRHFTLDEINEQPIERNSQLGYYTNFMNLLDYAAIAVPTAITEQGMPFGITLFSDAMSDQKLLSYADRIQTYLALPLGATDFLYQASNTEYAENDGFVDLVVGGAHLSGMALNWQLKQRQAVLLEETKTTKKYKMFAVPGKVERPALVRDEKHGKDFIVEVWRLPIESFGSFVKGIAQPLGIGKVELADGRWLTGFIAEGYASDLGEPISQYDGWRSYLGRA